ncbi:MAG: hypothetical protein ACF8CQ_23835 [Rhodopirellula sp. JB044]|uniref:hypothetical protein n=1 Tax=Rhodopirellula sp. JB044 TaxID=3342844 RepID=UPI00370B3E8A
MRDTFRTVGALTGLCVGLSLMWLLGWGGVLASGFFGAIGAVVGGMAGERIHDRGER